MVSGEKLDLIIGKLGFQNSHHAEAVGFSNAIWIGWRDSVNVEIKSWNKEVYGHIFTRKKIMSCKLENIEIEHNRTNSDYPKQVDMDIREELENELHHEKVLWQQKARCQGKISLRVLFFRLNDKDFNFLNTPVSDEEIKIALFDMTPLKALGSDGYHALFYQSQWENVGDSVIVDRFKVVSSRLIASEQTSFVARRNITDNIVIAQEVIHSIRGTQKNMQCMAIKVDLEKAYDRLGHSICNTNEVGNCSPIRQAQDGPLLSYLFFANGLILFGHTDDNQTCVMKDILDEFCDYSIYQINIQKTNIFFSKSVDDSLGRCISDFLGFPEVINLGHYLGVPLLHDKVTSSTLRFVVDTVHSKLTSWNTKQLSFVGKVTLAQSILLSIPICFMQTMMVPKGICAEIECMLRKFVLGIS
ncbi:uncharacterized protein [Gossypium hirsutum]|uniref:Reverse transcriptase n=1 Tax=Gossypium hirsutum TaxID=3635 RepID=A0A1U8PGR8_GOSHI|nr:uncharacterized protein LOC107958980 [Gossypium hirsutum]